VGRVQLQFIKVSRKKYYGNELKKDKNFEKYFYRFDPRSLGTFSGASDSSMCPGVYSASKNE